MTTIVKAADAAYLLSLAPSLLGFTPTRSLVVVPMGRSRSLGALRVDLPEPAGADHAATTVVGMVCRISGADAVTAVVYTDAACGGRGLPHRELAAALQERADACGLDVVDALCVAADGWGSYLDPGCPPGGRPLGEIVRIVIDDVPAPVGDQASGAGLPAVTEAERADVAAAIVEIERVVPRLCTDGMAGSGPGGAADGAVSGGRGGAVSGGRGGAVSGGPGVAVDGGRGTTHGARRGAGDDASDEARLDPRAIAAAGDLDDLPRLFDDALDGGDRVAGFAAAVLLWCLARPALRDIALVAWARGMRAGDDALEAQLGWERGEQYPERLAMILWGEGPRPDVARLGRALALARRLAALAPTALSAGPHAVCAWLSWALGRSTHAERYASAAHAADPEHGFAGIMLSFVAVGHLPDWAFRPSSTAELNVAMRPVPRRRSGQLEPGDTSLSPAGGWGQPRQLGPLSVPLLNSDRFAAGSVEEQACGTNSQE